MNTPDSDHIRKLMMASIDGESSPEEEQELKEVLLNYSEWAEEYYQLKAMKEMTSKTKLKEPQPELWDSYKRTVFTRVERGIGWILFTIGSLVLLFYGTWMAMSEILTDPELAWWIKAAIISATAGIIILLVSLVREKLYMDKHERYKDVIR